MKIRTRIAAVAATGALALAGAAAPALAAGPSGNGSTTVSATVQPALFLTLSGISPAISLTGRIGSTATATGAENYSVATNDSGYTLAITPGSASLAGTIPNCQVSCTATIANSNLSVAETSGQGTGGTFSGANALQVANVTGLDGSDQTFSYTENWSLAIPSTAMVTTYSEPFTYTAIGA